MNYIQRNRIEMQLQASVNHYPVTLLLGPRQCGKTTAAVAVRDAFGATYFDLEDPETPLKGDVAKLVLGDQRGLVIIDEFQLQPELFPLLRVLADRRPLPARFLVLGSASLVLARGLSESLAGRVSYVDMAGFTLDEVGADRADELWVRGGYPLSFLAESDSLSSEWRSNFLRSFLERDIPQLGIQIPAQTLYRFWMMMAHYHGQVWNGGDFARALGTQESTAKRYLDILTGAYMVRQLPAWFENIGKRLVKAPKVYVRDTGLLHTLLGLSTKLQVQAHPKLGFSWEAFALEQVIRMTDGERDAYFYKTHAGAELDLLLLRHGKRYGFEFKYEDRPRSTKSMRAVMEDLALERLWVVYPGEGRYRLTEKIEVLPIRELPQTLHQDGLMPDSQQPPPSPPHSLS